MISFSQIHVVYYKKKHLFNETTEYVALKWKQQLIISFVFHHLTVIEVNYILWEFCSIFKTNNLKRRQCVQAY